MAWTLQRARRPKGWYYQVASGKDRDRLALTLGYLSDEEADLARSNLDALPAPDQLVTVAWDREEKPPPPSKAAMTTAAKCRLLDNSVTETWKSMEEDARKETIRKIARGDLKGISLRDFHDQLWWRTRVREAAPSTVRSEKPYWKAILADLGHIPLERLSTARWTAFLLDRAETGGERGRPWGGTAQRLAQNAYRMALVHAVEIGALKEVHAFRKIKNSTKPSLEPVEPLTPEEIALVLGVARSVMYRALFAFALAQGLRPGEASGLQWEDIDWEAQTVRIRGTKTGHADAIVPLMPLAETHLATWWKKAGKPTEGPAFVRGGKQIKEWKSAWATACRKAGITRRVTCYMTRHTFATLAVASRSTPAAVKSMMRHSQKSTILEQAYTRLNSSQVRDGMSFPTI